jgi:WD40 repeat protein
MALPVKPKTLRQQRSKGDLLFGKQSDPILQGHRRGVTALAASKEDDLLVSGAKDNLIKIWSLSQGEHLHSLGLTKSWVRSLAIQQQQVLACSDQLILYDL